MAETGPFVCVVEQDISKIKTRSSLLTSDLRKLRRDLARCRLCPRFRGCDQVSSFKEAIDEALGEIYQEWGLRVR